MSSWFDGFKRMMQGKQPFDTNASNEQDIHHPASHNQAADSLAPPRVYIEKSKCHINGAHMQCHTHIINHSGYPVMLDKIRLLGTVRELDTTLKPGEAKEFLVYSGELPRDGSKHDAYLEFRDPTGNYFSSFHDVDLARLPNGHFELKRFRYQNLKDI